jgi:hypothetical protein
VIEIPGMAPKNNPIAIPGTTHSQVSKDEPIKFRATNKADISNMDKL